jgi:putative ABC transport system permease protein
MWIFLVKFFRDLGESKGQFVSVLAVVIIGVMFYTGLYSALEDFSGAGDKYFKEYRLGDLWCSVYRAPEGVVERIESISGVKMAAGRVVQDVRIYVEDRNVMVRLISMPDQKSDTVNDIMLTYGSYFSSEKANQCIISDKFFKANHLSIGQTIEPIINGERVKLTVIGAAKSPEYTYEIREATELIPDPQKFGVVYVKKSFLQSALDYKGYINDISVLLDQDGDVKKVKEEMKRVLDQYGVISTVERKDQTSFNMFNTDAKALESLSAIFPMLFFIASAVIIYITMTRMIENQRTLMGVLKAFGYNNWQIMLHYQTYPFLVGILGSITGSVIGVFFIGKGMLGIFNMLYDIPTGDTAVHLRLVLPASLMALFFCMLAGYNACKKELRLVPAESMRPKPPASGKRALLESFRLFWECINFSWKIIFRNLFRYKKRSVMTSIGIIFSMALLLVALSVRSSMGYLMSVQYEDIQKFDMKISFSKIMSTDELNYMKSIDHVVSVEPILETGMEISSGWQKKDIGIMALENGSKLYGVYDRKGNPAILPPEGILLPERLMAALRLDSGDQVYLRSYYPGKNEEKNKKAVIVKGVTSQFIGQSGICSIDFLDYLLGEGVVTNAAHIKLEGLQFEKEVTDQLKGVVAVSTIQSKAEVVVNTEKTLKSMNSIILFMLLGASILAIAVIYNITNINIFERRRELATLSVLGFTEGELKSLVFNENYFVSAFGVLAGMPLGRFLAELVIQTQANDNMQLPTILKPSSYLTAAIMVMLFTAMTNFLIRNKITSINMVESLKSAE